MCQLCGCRDYVSQGKEAVLQRAVQVVRELGLTPENAALFEDGEYICGLLAPKVALSPESAEVWEVVQWVHRLHQELNQQRQQAAEAAARDVFSRLPARGYPKEVITLYHHLEQLSREITDEMLASLEDAAMRAALGAMRHVHDNAEKRKAELSARYGLQ